MGSKTKIDWADATWNPVTGCLHGCTYCYAQRIANRFSGHAPTENLDDCCKWPPEDGRLDCGDCQKCNHVLNEPFRRSLTYEYMQTAGINAGKIEPYPYGFNPTLHRYRLDEPRKWKKPKTIFVCSMADLFGEWVPDEWIQAVFESCKAAPQHRYLFLTKNPDRYVRLNDMENWNREYFRQDNFWFGTTVTKPNEKAFLGYGQPVHTFVSVEPIREDFGKFALPMMVDWVIVGAETGNRKDKISPEKEWINHITDGCAEFGHGTPVFMKESIRGVMGADFRQEFPWEETK